MKIISVDVAQELLGLNASEIISIIDYRTSVWSHDFKNYIFPLMSRIDNIGVTLDRSTLPVIEPSNFEVKTDISGAKVISSQGASPSLFILSEQFINEVKHEEGLSLLISNTYYKPLLIGSRDLIARLFEYSDDSYKLYLPLDIKHIHQKGEHNG